jgi:hypothetical protein
MRFFREHNKAWVSTDTTCLIRFIYHLKEWRVDYVKWAISPTELKEALAFFDTNISN